MLDVLDRAGLLVNVFKGTVLDGKLRLEFTTDPRTGVKFAGMIGKKGGLDKVLYDGLIREHLEAEPGAKIFLFHCALAEVKPKELEDMEALPVSYLPRGFVYYAGGHVHVRDNASIGGLANIVYPGPTYPNNIAELEKLQHGSFVLYEDGKVTHVPIAPHPVVCVSLECQPSAIRTEAAIKRALDGREVKGAIVALRVRGTLVEGKPSDIPFEAISQSLMERGAFAVLRSTAQLSSKEFAEIKVKEGTVEDVERELIASQKERRELIPQLMSALASQKDEGEKVADFEKRVRSDVDALLGWNGKF
jgi:DNA repair exonuclease SbcCD nuclease subunit